MDDFVVREKLLDYLTTGEPPMSLTSDGLLAQGSRRHRLRVLGGGATGVALAVTAAFVFAPGGSSPPSWPALSAEACLSRVPLLPAESRTPAASTVAPTAHAETPLTADEQARVTCYMVDTVVGMLPGVSFYPTTWRSGKPPFQPVDDGAGLSLAARTPTGAIQLVVNRRDPSGSDVPTDANVAEGHGHKETRPDGTIVVTEDHAAGDGFRQTSVEVWTHGTHIIAVTDNVGAIEPAVEASGPTPLTLAQITEIATAPELRLYG